MMAQLYLLSSKTQRNSTKTQGISPKLNFSETPFPYVAAKAAKKKPAITTTHTDKNRIGNERFHFVLPLVIKVRALARTFPFSF